MLEISIKENTEAKETTLMVTGRVDTTTSSGLQKSIEEEFPRAMKIILDFANIEYISSVGLRVLLLMTKRAMKENKKFVITNVPQNVKEIFEITGFISILVLE